MTMEHRLPDDLDKHRNVTVAGLLGNIVVHIPYTEAETQAYFEAGIGIPLELVPINYWWQDGLPRYGEENLGADF